MSPIAGPLASSTCAQNPTSGGGSHTSKPIQHPRPTRRGLPSLPTSISTPTSPSPTSEQLSDRDQDVLAAVARFRVMSGAQLRELFWPQGTAETPGAFGPTEPGEAGRA